MKKRLLLPVFFATVFILQLHSQPNAHMIDIALGSRVRFNNLHGPECGGLYIHKWVLLGSHVEDFHLHILKKQDKPEQDTNSINIFFIKGSEFDDNDNDNDKIISLVYEDKVMVLKIKKNKRHVRIIINDFYFREGIYSIDLMELYEQYGKIEDDRINIEKFPIERDFDLTGDRIATKDWE